MGARGDPSPRSWPQSRPGAGHGSCYGPGRRRGPGGGAIPRRRGHGRGPAAPAMSFHQGQVLKYRVHLTSDLEFTAAGQSYPLKAAVTELVAMHVVGVASDGTATVKVVASHATGVINGTRLPPAARKPQKV